MHDYILHDFDLQYTLLQLVTDTLYMVTNLCWFVSLNFRGTAKFMTDCVIKGKTECNIYRVHHELRWAIYVPVYFTTIKVFEVFHQNNHKNWSNKFLVQIKLICNNHRQELPFFLFFYCSFKSSKVVQYLTFQSANLNGESLVNLAITNVALISRFLVTIIVIGKVFYTM